VKGHTVHPDSTDSESSDSPKTYLLLMASTKGLTLKDYNWINSKCRAIAKLERHGVRWTGFSGQAPSLTSEAGYRP
jgi:uncharacterized membrane protein YdfJ with MMPL/SSD domain